MLKVTARHDCGSHRHVECAMCGAWLFRHEHRGHTKSTVCCNKGTVSIRATKTNPTIDALWRAGSGMEFPDEHSVPSAGRSTRADQNAGQTFRRYGRRLNEALALASEIVDDVPAGERRHQAQVILHGKLTHCIAPVRPNEGHPAKGWCQLYTFDPADATAERSGCFMVHDKGAKAPEIKVVRNLLKQLDSVLRECNPYVQDYLKANEARLPLPPHNTRIRQKRATDAYRHTSRSQIFNQSGAEDATFYLDAGAAPADAGTRTYGTDMKFNEVSVIMKSSEGEDGNVPKRSVILHDRVRGGFDIDKTVAHGGNYERDNSETGFHDGKYVYRLQPDPATAATDGVCACGAAPASGASPPPTTPPRCQNSARAVTMLATIQAELDAEAGGGEICDICRRPVQRRADAVFFVNSGDGGRWRHSSDGTVKNWTHEAEALPISSRRASQAPYQALRGARLWIRGPRDCPTGARLARLRPPGPRGRLVCGAC